MTPDMERMWSWIALWLGAGSVVVGYFWQYGAMLALGLFFMLVGAKMLSDQGRKSD